MPMHRVSRGSKGLGKSRVYEANGRILQRRSSEGHSNEGRGFIKKRMGRRATGHCSYQKVRPDLTRN